MKLERIKKKIRYETNQRGDQIEVTAFLPPEFTMRTYTRIFRMEHAEELQMTPYEYIQSQQDQMFNDLVLRLRKEVRETLMKELGRG